MSIYSEIDRHPFLLRFLLPRKWTRPACRSRGFHGSRGGEYCNRLPLIRGRSRLALGLAFSWKRRNSCGLRPDCSILSPKKINLVVADYRGYGRSSGQPTFTGLVKDAPLIFEAAREKLAQRGLQEKLFVMGRSLGSVPALELAAQYAHAIPGLIIESGFISVTALIRHLGLPAAGLDLAAIEEESRRKAAQISIPVLIIHGQADSLVPYSQAEELDRSLGSESKQLVPIPGADHNDVIFYDRERYFTAIEQFVKAPGRA